MSHTMHNGVRVQCPRSTVVRVTTADGRIVRVVATSKTEANALRKVALSLGSFVREVKCFTPRG